MNFGLLHLPGAGVDQRNRACSPEASAFTVWAGTDEPRREIVQDALQAHANMAVPIPGPDHLRHGRIDDGGGPWPRPVSIRRPSRWP